MLSIYCTIKLLHQIKHFLTNHELSILVSSLILSKIDYCNSLSYNANNGLLQKLQIAQNSTARLIYHKRRLHNSVPADISLLLHLALNKCTRLKVTFNRRKVSDGAFSIYASKLLSSLPDRLRQLDHFNVFKCDLKTYLFSQYFLSH